MSVDYDATGGIGVYISDEKILELAIAQGLISEEDDDSDIDMSELCDNLELPDNMTISTYGNFFSGEVSRILVMIVDLENGLEEFVKLANTFKSDLRTLGMDDNISLILEGTIW